MTRNEIASHIILSLSGGRLNSGMSVRRPQALSAVDIAIRYMFLVDYRERRQLEQRDELASNVTGVIDANLAKPVEFDIIHDETDEYAYAFIPVGITIPSHRWLREVRAKGGRAPGIKLEGGRAQAAGFEPRMAGGNFCYWSERGTDQWKLVFKSISPLIRSGEAVIVIDPSQYGPDEPLPIPFGREADVIRVATEILVNQRQIPQDLTHDNTDNVPNQ